MSIPFWRRAWLDGAREHYQDWSGYTDDLDDEDDWTQAPVEAIPFPDPELDDHDRRFSDMCDTREGDIGDEAVPF